MRTTLATLVVIGLGAAAAPASAEQSWHRVQEPWQPFPEDNLTLPADQYCGDFDLALTGIRQGIRSRVLTRWDTGAVRTTTYAGVLITRATNTSTEESVRVNLSGHATMLQRPDGSYAEYTMDGPVGMGWPTGSGSELAPGYYVMRGRHVVAFDDSGLRTLAVDQGTQTDLCRLVD